MDDYTFHLSEDAMNMLADLYKNESSWSSEQIVARASLAERDNRARIFDMLSGSARRAIEDSLWDDMWEHRTTGMALMKAYEYAPAMCDMVGEILDVLSGNDSGICVALMKINEYKPVVCDLMGGLMDNMMNARKEHRQCSVAT